LDAAFDPTALLQRTGYACFNEFEYPLDSGDSYNYWMFFDDTCLVETTERICHFTRFPEESCTEALDLFVGSTKITITWERLLWDQAIADQYTVGTHRMDTNISMVAYPKNVDDLRVYYRYFSADSCEVFEGCITEPGWRRILDFTSTVINNGQATMLAGNVTSSAFAEANMFQYSTCHGHYHFQFYANFSLGNLIGSKQAFCLQSTWRYMNTPLSPLWNDYASCRYQGIEVGWGDDYIGGLSCQWMDITKLASPSHYTLKDDFNPWQFLCEGTIDYDSNGEPLFMASPYKTKDNLTISQISCNFSDGWNKDNVAEAPIDLLDYGTVVTQPCYYQDFGPYKDCDFMLNSEKIFDCEPGKEITVSISVTQPSVARFCEYSLVLERGTYCEYEHSLSNVVVLKSEEITLECPMGRDDVEVGGKVQVMIAPLLGSDTTVATISLSTISPSGSLSLSATFSLYVVIFSLLGFFLFK